MPEAPASILQTYLHVRDSGRAAKIAVTDSFWQELGGGLHPELDEGRLLSAFSFAEAWSSWERHPAGDELVMLLSGQATLLLEEAAGERSVELRNAGDFLLVPANVWHTARTSVATTMLFLTPGAGTEHRAVSE